jgi:tetratricopeptide (TPR) repeat protein
MSASHPDEATLLRSVVGELSVPRQADLRRHLGRCRPCVLEGAATRRLHERLSAAGDSLAFAAGDPFMGRPVPRHVGAVRGLAAKAMALALGRLESERERLFAAIESNATEAARVLDLDDAACRLAAAHVLEEAAATDPSERLAEFADAVAEREVVGEEAEAVLPGAQLRALAHLVLGNFRLFTGRPGDAATELRFAWVALGAFDAPEHLCACVEVGESLRRSYEGRPVVGRRLAERALETFERYGLARGIVRARHARAVALYMGSEFREAHREFRAVIGSKDATGLDRARGTSGAAFCLAARGLFHDAAKEYSRVRRRLRGEGAQVEQYLLQGEMKAALGTAGRWHPRPDGLAAFALPETRGAFRARETASEIVKAVSEEGLERAQELLGKIESDPSRGYAYLYACQLAMPKVSSDPAKYVAFAKAIADVTRSLPYLRDKGPAQPVCREQVMGEAALLESNALNFLGNPAQARKAAQKARVSFVEANEDSFALALADYFEGSAASFAAEFPAAWKLLRASLTEFQVYGQENWQGRAEAELGILLLNRGNASSALDFYDSALRNLHPERDEIAYASTLVNRGYALVRLSRFDAAKATYAKALMIARRLDMKVSLLTIRYGLASIDLEKGNLARALAAFERLSVDAHWIAQHVLSADLRIAECIGRMGDEAEMIARLEKLRAQDASRSLEFDPALRELFASVDERSVSYELLAHVARFAEARDRGVRAAYKPFRLVANGY